MLYIPLTAIVFTWIEFKILPKIVLEVQLLKVTTLDIFSKHFSFSGWIVCGGESENAVQQVTTAGDGVCVFEASSAYSTKE